VAEQRSGASPRIPAIRDDRVMDYFERTHHGNFWRSRGSQPLMFATRLRTLKRHAPIGSLLDIGCGEGYFLAAAGRAGWNVTGCDYLPEGVTRTAALIGAARVAHADACDLPFPAESFDVATLWDVIEHLANPAAAISEARRVLRPGGLLAFSTPNTRARSVTLKGSAASQYQDDTHVSLLSPEVWDGMFTSADLKKIISGTDAHWDIPYPGARRFDVLARIVTQIRFATRYTDPALADGENLVGLWMRP